MERGPVSHIGENIVSSQWKEEKPYSMPMPSDEVQSHSLDIKQRNTTSTANTNHSDEYSILRDSEICKRIIIIMICLLLLKKTYFYKLPLFTPCNVIAHVTSYVFLNLHSAITEFASQFVKS